MKKQVQKKESVFQRIKGLFGGNGESDGHSQCGCGDNDGWESCCSSTVVNGFKEVVEHFNQQTESQGCGCQPVKQTISCCTPSPSLTEEELEFYTAIFPKVFNSPDEYAHYMRTGKVRAPDFISIDPANSCNLKCSLCICSKAGVNYKKGIMSFEVFKTIVDKIPSLKGISLFNWGEPFLNPHLFDMIEYADKKNIITIVHSNFSLKRQDNFFERIVTSGLSNVVLSVDGASRKSYEMYRRGGDFELVISNMKRLVKIKKELKSDTPIISWKFIIHKYNEREIEKARLMAEELGISFMTDEIGLSENMPDFDIKEDLKTLKKTWLPRNKEFIKKIYKEKRSYPLYKKSICPSLFQTMIVNWDGKVFPCCWATDSNNVFGDLLTDSFDDIWNNEQYRSSRSLFIPRSQTSMQTICSVCHNFKKNIYTDNF